ncbi:MAG: copper transporter [Actinomycetota bacterium]
MVDFRYLLVTIVAVFLALGIGVLMGNVGLDVPEDIEDRIDSVEADNDRLRAEIEDLDRTIAFGREFGEAVEQWLVTGTLAGEDVVLFEVDGSDGSMVDDLQNELEAAGARVMATVAFNDKLALDSAVERDELALILRSTSSDGTDLRAEAALAVGGAAAAAAQAPGRDPQQGSAASQRIEQLLDDLEEADYVSVERDDDDGGGGGVVSVGASFLVVAGSESEPPFEVDDFVVALAEGLAQRGAGVLAAEPGASSWDVVPTVRDDGEVNDSVATVDQADSIAGQIAVVMALDLAARGLPGHYGVDSGATSVIPQPTSSPSP